MSYGRFKQGLVYGLAGLMAGTPFMASGQSAGRDSSGIVDTLRVWNVVDSTLAGNVYGQLEGKITEEKVDAHVGRISNEQILFSVTNVNYNNTELEYYSIEPRSRTFNPEGWREANILGRIGNKAGNATEQAANIPSGCAAFGVTDSEIVADITADFLGRASGIKGISSDDLTGYEPNGALVALQVNDNTYGLRARLYNIGLVDNEGYARVFRVDNPGGRSLGINADEMHLRIPYWVLERETRKEESERGRLGVLGDYKIIMNTPYGVALGNRGIGSRDSLTIQSGGSYASGDSTQQ